MTVAQKMETENSSDNCVNLVLQRAMMLLMHTIMVQRCLSFRDTQKLQYKIKKYANKIMDKQKRTFKYTHQKSKKMSKENKRKANSNTQY